MRYQELTIEGRNAVLEAFRSGRPVDKLFVQDGCKDGPVQTITREARKHDTVIQYVNNTRITKNKCRAGVVAQQQSACLASMRPWVRFSAPHTNLCVK